MHIGEFVSVEELRPDLFEPLRIRLFDPQKRHVEFVDAHVANSILGGAKFQNREKDSKDYLLVRLEKGVFVADVESGRVIGKKMNKSNKDSPIDFEKK